MQFYRIVAEIDKETQEPLESERAKYAYESELHFEENGQHSYIAAINISGKSKKALLCAAFKTAGSVNEVVENYLNSVRLPFYKIEIHEITLLLYFNLLQTSCRNNYIFDNDDTALRLKLINLDRHFGCEGLRYTESVVPMNEGMQNSEALSAEVLCHASLSAEIKRIGKGAKQQKVLGHPVHYLVQSDDPETKDAILKTLITALWEKGRIVSRRYCEISLETNGYLSKFRLNELYESCDGGTVVINADEYKQQNDEYVYIDGDIIAGACNIVKKYRNHVLTIICTKRGAFKTQGTVMQLLQGITLVQINEEVFFDNSARTHLRGLAQRNNLKPDKYLYESLKSGTAYTAADLKKIYDGWYEHKLITSVFKQYSDLKTAGRQAALMAPKGCAIHELDRMVGLKEAKTVIHQALDLYKAQQLFRDKGFYSQPVSMHMIFSGNPGTAKTTVARLLGQIMKDNNLLPVGDLYEVSRADIVGKYVGSTAPLVKKIFKAASGSVLFIDEAYSLVERNGLYGDEAINTIVQEMENRRNDTVVIFAGYPGKMNEFLTKNPGLRSRIPFHVPFEDYSVEELIEISHFIAAKNNIVFGEGVCEKLMDVYKKSIRQEGFGNGRFVRNLLEKATMQQATRLLAKEFDSVSATDVLTLLPEDFVMPTENYNNARVIGF